MEHKCYLLQPTFFFGMQEDVELMSVLGFRAYRFSIAWTRIFPGTFSNMLSVDPNLND